MAFSCFDYERKAYVPSAFRCLHYFIFGWIIINERVGLINVPHTLTRKTVARDESGKKSVGAIRLFYMKFLACCMQQSCIDVHYIVIWSSGLQPIALDKWVQKGVYWITIANFYPIINAFLVLFTLRTFSHGFYHTRIR